MANPGVVQTVTTLKDNLFMETPTYLPRIIKPRQSWERNVDICH